MKAPSQEGSEEIMISRPQCPQRRLARDAGIAIGPILFVVAILAVLAAAIAAGSGSFTSGTSTETSRTKASAMIEIGHNLKVGFDRITGLGTDHTDVVIDPDSTSNDNDLFSPSGGGINTPSVTMANDPATDTWEYPTAAVPKLGTSSTETLAMIRISSAVCKQVNQRANSVATPAAADIGDPTTGALGADAANWPNVLKGKMTGCINSNNADEPGYWFYQVLGIQ